MKETKTNYSSLDNFYRHVNGQYINTANIKQVNPFFWLVNNTETANMLFQLILTPTTVYLKA